MTRDLCGQWWIQWRMKGVPQVGTGGVIRKKNVFFNRTKGCHVTPWTRTTVRTHIKSWLTGLCEWNPSVTGVFPTQRATNKFMMHSFKCCSTAVNECRSYMFMEIQLIVLILKHISREAPAIARTGQLDWWFVVSVFNSCLSVAFGLECQLRSMRGTYLLKAVTS